MIVRILHTIVALVLVALVPSSASALDAAGRCEAGKNQGSGLFASCMFKAEARLVRSSGVCSVADTRCARDEECPPVEDCVKDTTKYGDAVAKCESKYLRAWDTWEARAAKVASSCPDGLLEADVQAVLDACVANVAAGLAGDGLSDCPGDLATCDTSFSTCADDLDGCQNPTCGDGQADLGEQCDGTDLNGANCTSFGFAGGALACSSCAFDVSGCVGSCGNGVIDNPEQCDGDDLGGKICSTLGYNFVSGILSCTAGCAFDTSDCKGCGLSGGSGNLDGDCRFISDSSRSCTHECALAGLGCQDGQQTLNAESCDEDMALLLDDDGIPVVTLACATGLGCHLDVGDVEKLCTSPSPECDVVGPGVRRACVCDLTDPIEPVCIPDCNGIECGDDGCSGSCGGCASGEACEAGECCGDSFASCLSDSDCCATGQCIGSVCLFP